MFLRCRLPRLDTEMSIMVFTSLYVSSEMQMPPGSANRLDAGGEVDA